MKARTKPAATLSPRTAWTTRCTAAIAAIAAVAVLALACASAAGAALQPIELHVDGGEESWHAQRSFAVRWTNPPEAAAVHYRLLDPSGQVAIGETRIEWPASAIEHLTVPPASAAYTVEVWLEDAQGGEGAPASAELRFDDVAPGHVDPNPISGWIGRTAFPYTLRLGHPAGAEPLSGIRGYAVSIDAAPDGSPCAGPYTCSETETDLRGGAALDSMTVAYLPEGESHVHAVAVSGSGVRSAVAGSALLRVDTTDPVTELAGAPSGWSNGPLTLTATAADALSGMAPSTESGSGPFTAIRIDGGAPTVASGNTVSTTAIASGIHTVAYYARDAAGNVDDGGAANGEPNRAPATATIRIDREAPRLAFANAQDPRDPERIEARAADPLSGLDPSRGSIAVRPAGSGERFEPLPTELSGETLRARWGSEAYPPGEYEFRATAHDLAGNATSTQSRAGGSPMRLRNPLKIETTLLAGFRRRTAVPYGRSISFRGRLVAGRRTPLAGRQVRVIERFEDGAEPRERVSLAQTGPGGGFGIRLRPGPSRQVFAVAAPTPTLRGASSRPLELAVRSGARMRVSSAVAQVGGRPVLFSGSVASAGAAIPAGGKIVELQFRLPGLPWSEFRTIGTDSRGRFRYPYRFADDDSRGVRFQFRAFAPAQAGWPFEPAGSRPVTVRGV